MATTAPRITTRVDTETQALLAEAASLAGLPSINAFVLSAAIERAKEIMERERVLRLSNEGTATLLEALDQPATAPIKLASATRRYRNGNAHFARNNSAAAKRSRRAAESKKA
jgi:uncharacterized protein (DUF1778 family)